ncbi:MAG: family 16 glycoside hydrolase [Chryseolinea sp.]
MKYILRVLNVLLLTVITLSSYAQQSEKLTSLLSQLPAQTKTEEQNLYKSFIALSDADLNTLTASVVPNGDKSGIKSRYGISLLTHTATSKEDKLKIEKLYLDALGKASSTEVKAYFIDNLKLVGSSLSVTALKSYVEDKDLFEPAVTTIVTIGGNGVSEELLAAIKPADAKLKVIKALGKMKYKPGVGVITKLAAENDVAIKKQSLWSLAWIADPSSAPVLKAAAKSAGYKNDPTEATVSLVEYLHQQTMGGDKALAKEIANEILANTPDPAQQHIRLTALSNLVKLDPEGSAKLMIKEASKFDIEYQKEVLKLSGPTLATDAGRKLWAKEYKKATGVKQGDVLALLAASSNNEDFAQATLIPALSSGDVSTRTSAATALGKTKNKKYAPHLLDYLMRSKEEVDRTAAHTSLLQVLEKSDYALVIQKLTSATGPAKVELIKILAARRATESFKDISALTSSEDAAVKSAAFEALPNVSASGDVDALIKLLMASKNEAEIKSIQSALKSSADNGAIKSITTAYGQDKLKVLPVLPYINDPASLAKVTSAFKDGSGAEKDAAFNTLLDWQNQDAVRPLLKISQDKSLSTYHAAALEGFLSQVAKSEWPDDEQLLLLREAMPYAKDKKEKSIVLRAAGNIRTFLSLVFVSSYLDDPELSGAASRSAMQIALPTSDARPGMTGVEVRSVLNHMLDKLTGADSQYERIDIQTYLENMPFTKGYESIFNGKDLNGWQGLVENPIARSKMTKDVLAKKQKEANGKVSANWNVKDGMIVFQGEGANLCTTRNYGDFEMLVDWKISKNGDSGIYLRGSPQVQIWDTTRRDVGAQVGSGGLYNNQKERSTPLVVADNPIGEWNTFYIKMIGDKVTVQLNGVTVVDNVVLENYWDRKIPIFPSEAIELQAHGTDLAFRNIYVKELSQKAYELTSDEKTQGFESLFDGKTLDQWVGNKVDYVVEDNTIAIYPGKESHGNLYTNKEYDNFILRFKFQLTPGANNGLGIHAPLEGDAAYVGKEIQILDNTASMYDDLQVWQFHGSVYGVIPAKKGFLKPVGDWNEEEVSVKGDYIKVTLNGTVITEGDLKKASAKGTLDHKDHPGLQRHSGHIGFLGHGSVVKFKDLRIKQLLK